MTSALLWSVVAFLCLAGWAGTLFIVTKSFVPQANSLSTLHKIDSLIDNRIRTVVERVQARTGTMPAPKTVGTHAQAPDEAASAAINDLFGSQPFEAIEQPDSSGMEIVE